MKVHINQLSLKRNYVILDEKFNDKLLDKLLDISGTIANASGLSGISKSVLGRLFRKENKKTRLNTLLKISELLKIPLDEVEKNIIWIGVIVVVELLIPNYLFLLIQEKQHGS